MKYAVVLCDGMADYPVAQLNGKTPMMCAHKPTMDYLAAHGRVGLVQTVPQGMTPGSDVANLSVMGYDPKKYYTGRSPLEALNIGVQMSAADVAIRCNLVTVSNEPRYADKTLMDYCASDIDTDQADVLIQYLNEHLADETFHFYTGTSYRHCLLYKNGVDDLSPLTPPHDITGQKVAGKLPTNPKAAKLLALMEKSYLLLKDHPINQERIRQGKNPANSIWLWGQGKKPALAPFAQMTGLAGSVISAVDLIKGIGVCSKMHVCQVPGATGYIDTNFTGKVQAALGELARGQDFVYLHVEAPDECGHRGEVENKIRAIELIDEKILAPLKEGLDQYDAYQIMVLPDHATPLCIRTHASDPVPFLIYRQQPLSGRAESFDEESAKKTGCLVPSGPALMRLFLGDQ